MLGGSCCGPLGDRFLRRGPWRSCWLTHNGGVGCVRVALEPLCGGCAPRPASPAGLARRLLSPAPCEPASRQQGQRPAVFLYGVLHRWRIAIWFGSALVWSGPILLDGLINRVRHLRRAPKRAHLSLPWRRRGELACASKALAGWRCEGWRGWLPAGMPAWFLACARKGRCARAGEVCLGCLNRAPASPWMRCIRACLRSKGPDGGA